MYVWQQPEWPQFQWDASALLAPLASARHKQGRLLGSLARLGFDLQLEAHVQALTEEGVKSSEIEGEVLDPENVRSSIARRLGVPEAALLESVDRKADGVVEMMLDATANHAAPLTAERLGGWHAALFPTGYSGIHRIRVSTWRDDASGPMQVVSGSLPRQRAHYEAPPAERLGAEMERFLAWFNAPPASLDGLLRSVLAHLWFVTVHPFDDGNGRIARAVADMALAQLEKSEQRFYSVSSQLRRERNAYYDILERTQKGTLDVTAWLEWFLACYERAIDAAESTCADVLRKADFWQRYAREPFSPRQKKVLNRFLDGFDGKLTAKKWAALGKCSVDTAERDIKDLVGRGIVTKNPGGSKNTSYALALGVAAAGSRASIGPTS